MIPACLPPRPVTRPKVPLPPNACDTHAHVFGPSDRFPYADDRSYTPPDAPLEKYLGMLDALGFARGVLVQGSAHGHDNSAMLDALQRQPERLRGAPMPVPAPAPRASRACFARSARAGAGASCRARIASARMHLITPTRGRFMKRWRRPIQNGWYGAATGRIRVSKAKCPMPGICSSCFRRGRLIRPPSNASSSTTPPDSTASRTESLKQR
jgi:hypothetical protein